MLLKNFVRLLLRVKSADGLAGVLTTEISIRSKSVISLISFSHSILYPHALAIKPIENHFNIQFSMFLNTLSKSFDNSTVTFKPFELNDASVVFHIIFSGLCCNSTTGLFKYVSRASLKALGATIS
jgi:hypothetical protein